MKQKWLQLEIFPKSIIVSTIFSLLMIITGSILLIVDTSYLYGVLVGIIILYISYLLIWLLWYSIPSIKTRMAKLTPVLAPLIRIVIFITAFLLVSLVINEGEGLEKFLGPINTIMILITYTLTLFSYGLVLIIDHSLSKNDRNKEIKLKA